MKICLSLTLLAMASTSFAAEEMARVISSTPVTQQVGVPRQACATFAAPGVPPQCSTQTVYENRTVGYTVIYELAGRQYSVQLPQDPGSTLRVAAGGTPLPQPLPLPLPSSASSPPVATSDAPSAVEPYPAPVRVTYPYVDPYSYPYPYPYASYGYGYGWGPVVSLGFVGGYYGGRYHSGHRRHR